VVNDLNSLRTELPNPRSRDLDSMSTIEILRLMNEEDENVLKAIRMSLNDIAEAVETVVKTLKDGGRVFYVGAGTSGRMAIADAAEIPPTFSMPLGIFNAIIAGGDEALKKPVEAVEDDKDAAINELKKHDFSQKDLLIGISASGRTPFVLSALEYAKSIGSKTVGIVNNPNTPISKITDIKIELDTGPEILTGSTRLKAGTSQKIVLNMISTTAMVKLGKVYDNLMVDLMPLNSKLIERATRIIAQVTGVSKETARKYLEEADMRVKVAIVMIKCQVDKLNAQKLLKKSEGHVRKAIENYQQKEGSEREH